MIFLEVGVKIPNKMFPLCNSVININFEVQKCISNIVRNQMHFIIGNIIIYDNFNVFSLVRLF